MFDNIIQSISQKLNNNDENCSQKINKEKNNNIFNSSFSLPITYLECSDIHSLSKNVSADLELVQSDTTNPMYDYLFKPKHRFAKEMIHKWNHQFTTNIEFLNDTKNVLKDTELYISNNSTDYSVDCDKLIEIWDNTKNDSDFLIKYSYIEWDFLKNLNESQSFLQCISVINLLSPLMSLLFPILLFLFPFIILKIQNIPITFNDYMNVLKTIGQSHFLGRALANMTSLSIDKIIYVLFPYNHIENLFYLQLM